jgi:hypothetical protein
MHQGSESNPNTEVFTVPRKYFDLLSQTRPLPASTKHPYTCGRVNDQIWPPPFSLQDRDSQLPLGRLVGCLVQLHIASAVCLPACQHQLEPEIAGQVMCISGMRPEAKLLQPSSPGLLTACIGHAGT